MHLRWPVRLGRLLLRARSEATTEVDILPAVEVIVQCPPHSIGSIPPAAVQHGRCVHKHIAPLRAHCDRSGHVFALTATGPAVHVALGVTTGRKVVPGEVRARNSPHTRIILVGVVEININVKGWVAFDHHGVLMPRNWEAAVWDLVDQCPWNASAKCARFTTDAGHQRRSRCEQWWVSKQQLERRWHIIVCETVDAPWDGRPCAKRTCCKVLHEGMSDKIFQCCIPPSGSSP